MNPVLEAGRQCPWCGKRNNLVTDRIGGQVLCGGCGLVVADKTEELGHPTGPARARDEPGAFSIAKSDMGLATVIGHLNVDGAGRAIPGGIRPSLERLRLWDHRSQLHTGTDRNLKRAMGELERLSEKVVVPDSVVEKAAYIYRKSIPLISARRRSITTLVAASLYAACRSTRTPRTLRDIGEAANLDRLDIARSYRLLVTENDMPQPVDDPGKSVSRIAYGAGLSTRVERKGLEILKAADKAGALTGNSPMGSAAASLYIASVLEGERSTKTHLAMVAGVTNVTIRNRVKVLISMLGLEPDRFDDIKARRKEGPLSPPASQR